MDVKPKPLCALVVDDEEPARWRLVERLKKDRGVGRIIEAEDGVAAVEQILQAKPDIVFLDVQMPGMDGFDVINAVGPDAMPVTVFVTAYDHFALQAFEADATDYLLKPFGSKRYDATMERVKRRLHDRLSEHDTSQLFGSEVAKLIAKRSTPGEIWNWIVVRVRDDTRLIMAEDIDWIEANGPYVTVHTAGEKFLYRGSLATFASRLDPFRFVRIHRSSLVNVKSIALFERRSHSDFAVVLKDGTSRIMSRRYRAGVEAMLGQCL